MVISDSIKRRVSKEFDEQVKELARQMGIPSVTATKIYSPDELIGIKKKKSPKSKDIIIEATYKKRFTIKNKKGRRKDLFQF